MRASTLTMDEVRRCMLGLVIGVQKATGGECYKPIQCHMSA